MSNSSKCLGIITITPEMLLDYLQFEGGEIRQIRLALERYPEIEILIEHPDLPEYIPGSVIARIMPSYRFAKRGKFVKMERVSPPKNRITRC